MGDAVAYFDKGRTANRLAQNGNQSLENGNRLAQNGESFSGENFVNHKSLYHSVLLMELLLGFYSKKY